MCTDYSWEDGCACIQVIVTPFLICKVHIFCVKNIKADLYALRTSIRYVPGIRHNPLTSLHVRAPYTFVYA